jgi:hypothetical protein
MIAYRHKYKILVDPAIVIRKDDEFNMASYRARPGWYPTRKAGSRIGEVVGPVTYRRPIFNIYDWLG